MESIFNEALPTLDDAMRSADACTALPVHMRAPIQNVAVTLAAEVRRLQAGGWISVKERLPSVDHRVYVVSLISYVGVAYRESDIKQYKHDFLEIGPNRTLKHVFAWAEIPPLPAPPNDAQEPKEVT